MPPETEKDKLLRVLNNVKLVAQAGKAAGAAIQAEKEAAQANVQPLPLPKLDSNGKVIP